MPRPSPKQYSWEALHVKRNPKTGRWEVRCFGISHASFKKRSRAEEKEEGMRFSLGRGVDMKKIFPKGGF